MSCQFFANRSLFATAARFGMALALTAAPAWADPAHGISMYGAPALPEGFTALPQVNADAPKGGSITLGESGSFDSLNPFITTGRPAVGISTLVVETLMGRNYDEPFALYGLLAESIDTDEARSYVEFTLRPEARFSDGTPVTVEDVLWSFETLGTIGNPRYHAAWKKIASAEATGPRSLRFTFNTEDRELPLILGLRPILQKAQWQGKDFEASGFEAPIGSGPYLVDKVDAGVSISYRKNPDWWGKDVNFNRGQWNFDEIRYEYFAQSQAQFEAFKAGLLTSYREPNTVRWATLYDFPAVQSGDIVKSEIPHHRPSGIEGLAFNTRKPLFADWRVREALMLAFNFEYINQSITGGAQPRITSYFSNSPLGYTPGEKASGKVAQLLAPFAKDLIPGTLEGYELPKGDGKALNRRSQRQALKLLEEAGWSPDAQGLLHNKKGEPFTFDILLSVGQDEMATIAKIYAESLKTLGIEAKVEMLDTAQMKVRMDAYDFDMTHYIRSLSLSPGNEQTLYWGSAQADLPATRNWMGIRDKAVDAMIAHMLAAKTPEDFDAAVM